MTAPRGRGFGHTANMYRTLDKEQAGAVGNPDDYTYLNDERFDAITEKVIAYMHSTPPEEWTKNQWGLFRALWTDRKSKRRLTQQEKTQAMSMEDLESLMSTDEVENS